jgi:hypothetical protein
MSQPNTPALTAGNAIERMPIRSASARQARKQEASSSGSVSPRFRFGPTVWITQRAARSYPPVVTASPTGSPSGCVVARMRRHSSSSSGPAARWIAPSTPPPPSKVLFAALTTASTCCCVMSPCSASISTHRA